MLQLTPLKSIFCQLIQILRKIDTVKPLNSRHLRILKNLSVIERCPLLRGNLKKIVTFWTKRFAIHGMSAIWDVRYWEVSQEKNGN